MNNKIAIYPGSFDPLTNGHMDIINRASKIFEKIIILVANNANKTNYLFTLNERVEMIKEIFKNNKNISVDKTSGLVVKKAKELGSNILIRGLRAVTDFENEFQIHEINEYLDPSIEMVYLMANKEQTFVSSSSIKEIFFQGEDVSLLVPKIILNKLKEKNETSKVSK